MAQLRIGTRGSPLALAQAREVRARLAAAHGLAEDDIALSVIKTSGDMVQDRPLADVGGKGLFTKEIDQALIDGAVDLAVHSAKDLPTVLPLELIIAGYLPREDARDALCGADALRPGMRIGTASVRRRAQLLALEPDLQIEPMRGNIDTRLRKRMERGLDAIVLAACGLDRLGLSAEAGYRFDPGELLPEAGQGALALQVRSGEEQLVAAVDDAETRRRVEAERACIAAVGGGCLAPVAAHHDGEVLTALVAAEDGSWIERVTGDDPAELGRELAALESARAT